MVSGAELAVLGTLAGSLITGSLSYFNTRFQQREETKRRRGEIFLERKADALLEVNRLISESEGKLDTLKEQSSGEELPVDVYSEVSVEEFKHQLQELSSAIDKASVYFSPPQKKKLKEATLSIGINFAQIARGEGELDLSDSDVPEDYNRAVWRAKQVLKEEIDEPTRFGNR